MSRGALPRRRFLQGLVALPALGRVASAACVPAVASQVPPGAVVEHCGWIVHERDREALCAAATPEPLRECRGALQ